MSKYEQLLTVFTDEGHLVEALNDLGYQPTRHTQPIHLIGYHGDKRPELAHVVIPRAQISDASNDLGFVREASGAYRAIISDFDSRSPAAKLGEGKTCKGFGQSWLGRLSQAYKERQTMAVAKSKGYVFQGRKTVQTPLGQKVQLCFSVR